MCFVVTHILSSWKWDFKYH